MQLHTHPVEELHWQVNRVCSQHPHTVDELQQSYLAHLLMRYLYKEDLNLFEKAPRLDLRHLNQSELRKLGDECLLICGLCPERATRVDANNKSTADLGQRCYRRIAEHQQSEAIAIYAALADNYPTLISILRAVSTVRETRSTLLCEQIGSWLNADSYSVLQAGLAGGGFLPADIRGLGSVH